MRIERMRRNSHIHIYTVRAFIEKYCRTVAPVICLMGYRMFNGNKLSLRSNFPPTQSSLKCEVKWMSFDQKMSKMSLATTHFLSQTIQIINSVQLWLLIYQFTASLALISCELSRVVNNKLVGNFSICETLL